MPPSITRLRASVVLLAATIAPATSHLEAQDRPAFEVASIKPAAPGAGPINQVVTASPNRLFIPSMTLTWLIYTAWGEGGFNTSMRVTGGPEWITKTTFTVEGMASGTPTVRERRRMLQVLLEERFALRLRVENSMVEMNTIVVDRSDGRLGPNVKAWDGTCRFGTPSIEDDPARARCPGGYIPGRLFLEGATMFSVAEALSLPQARSLVGTITSDRTGLTGRYTLELKYDFSPPRAQDAAAAPEFGAQPSLGTAVKEQWGLRFERGQGPFRLVTVESAQPLTAN